MRELHPVTYVTAIFAAITAVITVPASIILFFVSDVVMASLPLLPTATLVVAAAVLHRRLPAEPDIDKDRQIAQES